MKKLLLAGVLLFSSTLFADISIGVKIGGKHDKVRVKTKFRPDHHRHNSRYKHFNYKKHGYYDDYGYYYGYFDKHGYFYNNIYFVFDRHYTYRDRVKRVRHFKPRHAHFRPYKYHKKNHWNKKRKYRKQNQKIYGHYYNKHKRKR